VSATAALLSILGVFTAAYIVVWALAFKRQAARFPSPLELLIGFTTNFFDALGIGSFATTTSLFKLWRVVPDELIPGTLNVGITLPGIVEAFIFISIVRVDPATLVLMIVAATAGAWLGAGVVARWPRRYVQIGMGSALLVAATLLVLGNLHIVPAGGTALSLAGGRLWFAIAANFCLGALMTLGIGLFAPCMILVSLLGMSPLTAFPIMMGSCAFLMPVASARFIRLDRYAMRPALALTIAGIPAVLIAAFVVKSLPLTDVRWLVVAVVVYASTAMLRSAMHERRAALRFATRA